MSLYEILQGVGKVRDPIALVCELIKQTKEESYAFEGFILDKYRNGADVSGVEHGKRLSGGINVRVYSGEQTYKGLNRKPLTSIHDLPGHGLSLIEFVGRWDFTSQLASLSFKKNSNGTFTPVVHNAPDEISKYLRLHQAENWKAYVHRFIEAGFVAKKRWSDLSGYREIQEEVVRSGEVLDPIAFYGSLVKEEKQDWRGFHFKSLDGRKGRCVAESYMNGQRNVGTGAKIKLFYKPKGAGAPTPKSISKDLASKEIRKAGDLAPYTPHLVLVLEAYWPHRDAHFQLLFSQKGNTFELDEFGGKSIEIFKLEDLDLDDWRPFVHRAFEVGYRHKKDWSDWTEDIEVKEEVQEQPTLEAHADPLLFFKKTIEALGMEGGGYSEDRINGAVVYNSNGVNSHPQGSWIHWMAKLRNNPQLKEHARAAFKNKNITSVQDLGAFAPYIDLCFRARMPVRNEVYLDPIVQLELTPESGSYKFRSCKVEHHEQTGVSLDRRLKDAKDWLDFDSVVDAGWQSLVHRMIEASVGIPVHDWHDPKMYEGLPVQVELEEVKETIEVQPDLDPLAFLFSEAERRGIVVRHGFRDLKHKQIYTWTLETEPRNIWVSLYGYGLDTNAVEKWRNKLEGKRVTSLSGLEELTMGLTSQYSFYETSDLDRFNIRLKPPNYTVQKGGSYHRRTQQCLQEWGLDDKRRDYKACLSKILDVHVGEMQRPGVVKQGLEQQKKEQQKQQEELAVMAAIKEYFSGEDRDTWMKRWEQAMLRVTTNFPSVPRGLCLGPTKRPVPGQKDPANSPLAQQGLAFLYARLAQAKILTLDEAVQQATDLAVNDLLRNPGFQTDISIAREIAGNSQVWSEAL